jgi:hypothetical protein
MIESAALPFKPSPKANNKTKRKKKKEKRRRSSLSIHRPTSDFRLAKYQNKKTRSAPLPKLNIIMVRQLVSLS